MIIAVQQIIIGFIVLGVLVLIHELGHFVMAKWCGIRVLSFSIGFGTPLLKKNIGETEYRISAIPFGGYVHMAGEHPEDRQESLPDEYTSKPVYQRALVALAGPAANLVSAFAFLWIMFMWGTREDLYLERPVVGTVIEASTAQNAGFMAGDSITGINGAAVKTWEDIAGKFRLGDSPYYISIARSGKEKNLSMDIPPHKGSGIPESPMGGLMPAFPAVVGNINPGSPAEKAGFKPGDKILAIDSVEIHSWYHMSSMVASWDASSDFMSLEVRRGDSVFNIYATPEYNGEMERYLLGMTAGQPESKTVRYGPFSALSKAGDRTVEYTAMIFEVLSRLATRKVSPRQLAGPIGIVQMSGMAALGGLSAILGFMALIGINLAVLNLFPLVITDGGVLMFLIIESIRGKPVSLKNQILINKIAISLFIALFLFVTFNDVQRIPLLFRMFSR